MTMTAQAASTQDEWEFQTVPNKRNATQNKRLYIGNLPSSTTKQDILLLLQNRISESILTHETLIELVPSKKNSRAFVSGLDFAQSRQVIQELDQTEFQGSRLVVEMERKKPVKKPTQQYQKNQAHRKNNKNNNKNSNPFSGKRWSQPAVSTSSIEDPDLPAPQSLEEASERIESIVTQECTESDDGIQTLLATTAAVSLVASAGFNVAVDPSRATDIDPGHIQAGQQEPTVPFSTSNMASLSSLLQDYGEYDPSWKEKIPLVQENENEEEEEVIEEEETKGDSIVAEPPSTNVSFDSQLRQHGKAPIHVNFSTFGYHYGAPSDLRKGWSHAQPLDVFDSRDLPCAPQHLIWQDGLSGLIKRIMVQLGDREDPSTQVKVLAKHMAGEVAAALTEAMDIAGYGYAQPLTMVVYVASDYGKHRSVVAAEMGATFLRKLLRTNQNGKFAHPVSVGTLHRDISKQGQPTKRNKKRDDDDGE